VSASLCSNNPIALVSPAERKQVHKCTQDKQVVQASSNMHKQLQQAAHNTADNLRRTANETTNTNNQHTNPTALMAGFSGSYAAVLARCSFRLSLSLSLALSLSLKTASMHAWSGESTS
jgi:hypothetical protein